MDNAKLVVRYLLAARRQPGLRISPEAVFSCPGRARRHAVHSSQFAKYLLPGVVGETVSRLIAAYTLIIGRLSRSRLEVFIDGPEHPDRRQVSYSLQALNVIS